MHAISAAHPTMPLPSYARVTNLDNKRSIIVRVNDRGPYARNRVVDLSIGTAKALGFYGNGLARVRVEYVGRAPLAGSDDQMLLATLREGSPAPAPSKVMVASAKPFVPSTPDGKSTPARAERAVPTGSPVRLSQQASASDPASPNRSLMRSRSASADPRMDVLAPDASAPAAPRYEASTPGLMSGRGLY
jgi:rare lipoprotein A